jgi:hypothetical protein
MASFLNFYYLLNLPPSMAVGIFKFTVQYGAGFKLLPLFNMANSALALNF